MPVPYQCNVCSADVVPDSGGIVTWGPGQGAAIVHATCRSGRGSRSPIDNLRRGPIGVIADVLRQPSGAPWENSLPESIRGLVLQLFSNEAATAAGKL